MPDVPTVSEAGLKGYASEYWHGVVAPAKTPPAVVAKLNAAFVKAMASPELVGWINNAGSGAEWTGSTPVEMQAHMAQELKNSGELVKTIGLSLD
jgi:tripartite-type tricarboxylate transporter receptor subunit TctC